MGKKTGCQGAIISTISDFGTLSNIFGYPLFKAHYTAFLGPSSPPQHPPHLPTSTVPTIGFTAYPLDRIDTTSPDYADDDLDDNPAHFGAYDYEGGFSEGGDEDDGRESLHPGLESGEAMPFELPAADGERGGDGGGAGEGGGGGGSGGRKKGWRDGCCLPSRCFC